MVPRGAREVYVSETKLIYLRHEYIPYSSINYLAYLGKAYTHFSCPATSSSLSTALPLSEAWLEYTT